MHTSYVCPHFLCGRWQDLRNSQSLLRLRVPGSVGAGSAAGGEKRPGWTSSIGGRRGRGSSDSSSSSSGSDGEGVREEAQQVARWLQVRWMSHRRRRRSGSSSPEVSSVRRRDARDSPTSASACSGAGGVDGSRRSSSTCSRSSNQGDDSSSHSGTNTPNDDNGSTDDPIPSNRSKKCCIRYNARQQSEIGDSNQRSRSSCAVLQQATLSRTRSPHARAASATPAAPDSTCLQSRPLQRRRRRERRRLSRRSQERQRRQPRMAAVTATAALRRLSAHSHQQANGSAAAARGELRTGVSQESLEESQGHQAIVHPLGAVQPEADSTERGEARPCIGRGRRSRAAAQLPSAHEDAHHSLRSLEGQEGTTEENSRSEGQGNLQSRRTRRREPSQGQSVTSPGGTEDVAESLATSGSLRTGNQMLNANEGPGCSSAESESEGTGEAMRQAEALAAQLPRIRFPTYRAARRRIGGSQSYEEAKEVSDVPLVEMVDKIVFSFDGKLLLVIRRRAEPLIYRTNWEVILTPKRTFSILKSHNTRNPK